jgi:hypothetical protein
MPFISALGYDIFDPREVVPEFHADSDLEAAHKMDLKPFLEFNVLDVQENLVNELKRLRKETFDLGPIRITQQRGKR